MGDTWKIHLEYMVYIVDLTCLWCWCWCFLVDKRAITLSIVFYCTQLMNMFLILLACDGGRLEKNTWENTSHFVLKKVLSTGVSVYKKPYSLSMIDHHAVIPEIPYTITLFSTSTTISTNLSTSTNLLYWLKTHQDISKLINIKQQNTSTMPRDHKYWMIFVIINSLWNTIAYQLLLETKQHVEYNLSHPHREIMLYSLDYLTTSNH